MIRQDGILMCYRHKLNTLSLLLSPLHAVSICVNVSTAHVNHKRMDKWPHTRIHTRHVHICRDLPDRPGDPGPDPGHTQCVQESSPTACSQHVENGTFLLSPHILINIVVAQEQILN